ARIRQLSPGDLASRAVHSEIGEITLANLLAEWVIHDLGHIRQLIVAAAQPYLPAIGPWRPGYKHLELSPKP
ncbi:MAG TPA: DinB family protein, partial [Candidatus Methylomirabilis sp.]|nr:DinB family protein [Candidatus Methylomirabilis sp.]